MEFLTLIEGGGGDGSVLAVFVNEYENQFYFDLQALRLLRKLRCVDENELNNIIRALKQTSTNINRSSLSARKRQLGD